MIRSIILLSGMLFVAGCSLSKADIPEYGVFYVETQGKFIDPIEVDAPVIYRWTQGKESFQGNIEQLKKILDAEEDSASEFYEVEVMVLNKLALKGWRFTDVEIIAVTEKQGIRTAYKYIFRKDI